MLWVYYILRYILSSRLAYETMAQNKSGLHQPNQMKEAKTGLQEVRTVRPLSVASDKTPDTETKWSQATGERSNRNKR